MFYFIQLNRLLFNSLDIHYGVTLNNGVVINAMDIVQLNRLLFNSLDIRYGVIVLGRNGYYSIQ